ncbi:hypothetical protein BDW22DRAFT_863585 [Trametopsis cervina]|nr:hypothetical protein BDW22DRAFT_863585 [Trametopsis cervina]
MRADAHATWWREHGRQDVIVRTAHAASAKTKRPSPASLLRVRSRLLASDLLPEHRSPSSSLHHHHRRPPVRSRHRRTRPRRSRRRRTHARARRPLSTCGIRITVVSHKLEVIVCFLPK